MENILVRKATLRDAAILAELSADTFYQTFATEHKPESIPFSTDSAFSIKQLARELQDTSSIFLLAFKKNTAVGYAKLRKSKTPNALQDSKAIEIQRLYVVQSMIRQKVGKQLMEQCLSIAEQQSYETVWLGVWEQNPHAIAFYKKWGFEVFDASTFRLEVDDQQDFLMKKELYRAQGHS